MVKAGQFRDDLYYRLNAAAILVPPLRERREAIPAFVAHFIEHFNRLFGKDVKQVSRAALDALCANQWLGNVRELGHAIESAVLMTENDCIDVDDLPFGHGDMAPDAVGMPVESMLPDATLDLVEGAENTSTKEWPYSLDAVIREASKLALIRRAAGDRGQLPSRGRVAGRIALHGLPDAESIRTRRRPHLQNLPQADRPPRLKGRAVHI